MSEFDELFRMRIGKTFAEATRIPTPENVISQKLKEHHTRLPLRKLGWASDGLVTLAEEERTHTHILGLPGYGKSKFLELLIRGDIDNLVAGRSKAGLCLIDSSDFGNTYYKILKYCAKVGYEKVCLIDPNDFLAEGFGKFPTINPIWPEAPRPVVMGAVLEMMRILWDGGDFSQTAKIQQYLTAIVALLHQSKSTLYDAKYFFSRKNDFYNQRRNALLDRIPNRQFNNAAITISDLFDKTKNEYLFSQDIGSTVRRLEPLFVEPLDLMIASTASPLNFKKMIAEGWVVLCNLDPDIWDIPQARFLGTLIISEIIHASYRLVQAGRRAPYQLYIDEVGRYATQTLADLMNYKRTSGIKLTMAHQDFTQIKHPEVLAAIRNAGIKVLFYTERDDREKVVRQMFGGDVPLAQAVWEVGKLSTKEAYIRIGSQNNPRKTRITELPDISDKEVSVARLDAYKKKLYQQPWYKDKRTIYDEINARFKPTHEPTLSRKHKPEPPPAGSFRSPAKPQSERTTAPRGKRAAKREDPGSVAPGTFSSDSADSPSVLLRRKGRATRKILQDPPEEK